MPKLELVCCNKKAVDVELWFLADIKGFSSRKLLKGKCSVCNDDVITLIETRLSDNKIFINQNIKGIEAAKTLYREKKRIIHKHPNINIENFSGWVYGLNKEVRNKNGEIIQIRQYSCTLKGNKKNLEKVIDLEKKTKMY